MSEPSERAAESDAILAAAGLVYVSDGTAGIRRIRQDDKFVYVRGDDQLTELRGASPTAAPAPSVCQLLVGRSANGLRGRAWGLRRELLFAAQLGAKNRPQRKLLGRAHPGEIGGSYLRHDQPIIRIFEHRASLRLDQPGAACLAVSQYKTIPLAYLARLFGPVPRPIRGKDMSARLTRKRRSTFPPSYGIKHLVAAPSVSPPEP